LVPGAQQIPRRTKRQRSQHHGERWTTALDLLSELQIGRTLFPGEAFAVGRSDFSDHHRAQSGKRRTHLPHHWREIGKRLRPRIDPAKSFDETNFSKTVPA